MIRNLKIDEMVASINGTEPDEVRRDHDEEVCDLLEWWLEWEQKQNAGEPK